MVQTLDRTELPESTTAEPPERRRVRSILAWAGVATALAVAIALGAVALFGGSDSIAPAPVFTEHARLHAVESSVTPRPVYTEHGGLHAGERSPAPGPVFTEHGGLHAGEGSADGAGAAAGETDDVFTEHSSLHTPE